MKPEIKKRIEQIKNGEVPEGYKKTKVGIIPKDWEVNKYKKYLKICSGKDQKEISCENGKYPILATGGKIGSTNSYLCNKPSVLIGRKGTIDKPQYMDTPFWTVDTLFFSNVFDNAIAKYLYYNFCLVNWYKYNEASGVPSLSSTTIENIHTAMPNLHEQQKIVEILTAQDKVIELKEKLITEKERQKKYLMQQLLTGKKRLKSFSGEWKKVKLSDIGNTYSGLSDKNKEDFGYGKPYIPYLNIFSNSIIDINDLEYVNIKENEIQYNAIYGDIFFTTSSETPQEVGMSSVLLDNIEELYLNSFCFGFRLNNFNTLSPLYASHYFRGNTFRCILNKLAQGATRFNLSKNNLLKMEILIPPLDEQNAIAEILSKANKEIELLKQNLEQEKLKKKALMQLLLTGIVRV